MKESVLLDKVRHKYEVLAPRLHEQARRLWAACEARALGRGGISLVATATGRSRSTIHAGIRDLNTPAPGHAPSASEPERVRRPGGGRPRRTQQNTLLLHDLKQLVDAATRGDPLSALLWTCKSTRNLRDALISRGHPVSHQTVARLLTDLGYS